MASPTTANGTTPKPIVPEPLDFTGHFDVRKLNDHLRLCLKRNPNNSNSGDAVDGQCNGNGDSEKVEVMMDEYIQIFLQLYKFFCMLGTVFGFVGSDVKDKVEILQGYRTGVNKEHYETVEKMIAYEKETGYIKKNKQGSGSRTLLRLHRSLVFVSKFLDSSMTLKEEEGTAQICQEAYGSTLAKYHPWLIQKGANLAMYALPTKKELFKRVCDGHEPHEIHLMMLEAIKSTQEIYDKCEILYTGHDLLALP